MCPRAPSCSRGPERPRGALLSGGIDSSLVSAAAQRATGHLQTFNVQFPEGHDETWAALAVARHIGSEHRTLRLEDGEATWERVTSLLGQSGQPFADTSLFAVHAVSRLMREHVAVALSGDGGDEAFGGYDVSWQIARFARLQRVPGAAWSLAGALITPLAHAGLVRWWLPERIADLPTADDAGVLRNMVAVLREREQVEAFDRPRRAAHPPALRGAVAQRVRPARVASRTALGPHDRGQHPPGVGQWLPLQGGYGEHAGEPRGARADARRGSGGPGTDAAPRAEGHRPHQQARAARHRRPMAAARDRPASPRPASPSRSTPGSMRPSSSVCTTPCWPRTRRLRGLVRPDLCERWLTAFRDGVPLPEMSQRGVYQRAISLLSLHQALCPADHS